MTAQAVSTAQLAAADTSAADAVRTAACALNDAVAKAGSILRAAELGYANAIAAAVLAGLDVSGSWSDDLIKMPSACLPAAREMPSITRTTEL